MGRVNGADRARLDRLDERLAEIERSQQAHLILMRSLVDLFERITDDKAERDRHQELTGTGRHLRLVARDE
ncbi:hypothetical protein [Actinoallomurus sp. CA-150999]|uniref:hypothetical protein n=1 Tax=Actinoallomurus sp. CA-150999 TaxID=3239887 RepID=UPI003D904D66